MRPAWLADDPAGMAFRETVLLSNALDCLAALALWYLLGPKGATACEMPCKCGRHTNRVRQLRATFSKISA